MLIGWMDIEWLVGESVGMRRAVGIWRRICLGQLPSLLGHCLRQRRLGCSVGMGSVGAPVETKIKCEIRTLSKTKMNTGVIN